MNWLVGRKSKLTIENKLLLYKAIMKPIWSYGIQLWGCAKPSNAQIIQRLQSKTLRIVFNAPWYVSNKTLHKDSRIPFVEDEIIRMTNRYLLNLTGHWGPYIFLKTLSLYSHLSHPQRIGGKIMVMQ
jgi:hypothetical protein